MRLPSYHTGLPRRGPVSKVAALLLLCCGCDQTFEPTEPGERYFSLFGYLDVSADTQWIRVMPVRDVAPTSSQPINAVVTLENLETGQILTLNDSLFAYQVSNLDLSQRRYAHNFWTAETIEPEAVYRAVATRPAGRSSSAIIRIPPEIDDEVIVEINLLVPSRATISFSGVEHLPMVLVLPAPPGCRAYQSLAGATVTADGLHRVPVMRASGPDPLSCGDLNRKEIKIISSGSSWLFDPGFSEEIASLPDVTSNVKHGVGFIGGIVTKTVPFEYCTTVATPSRDDVCVLTYSSRSASLKGTVWDQVCGEQPLRNVSVSLSERGRDLIRSTSTDARGYFRIEALEPAVEYDLTFRMDDGVHFETPISFGTGERARLDVALRRGLPPAEPCYLVQ